MKAQFRAYASLTTANLKMYLRNPVASSSLFLALIVLLVAVKFVFDGPGPHTKVVLVDASGGAQAAALIKDVRAVSTFDVSQVSQAQAGSLLEQSKADLQLVIPSDFGHVDASNRPVPTRLDVTYRSGSQGESSLPILRGIVESYNEGVLGEVPTVSISASALHTRSVGVIDVFLPGMVAFNIIGSALMLAAGTFANYKSMGVLRRLKATGISPSIFVLAHATSSFVLGALQTAAILLAASILFTVHLNIAGLFLLLTLGYLVFLALGLAISGWVRDPQRATGIAQGVAFPMIFVALLSSALPPQLADITKYLPVSYVTDGMQQLGQGGGWSAIEVDVMWLAAWATALLVAAGRVFRWD